MKNSLIRVLAFVVAASLSFDIFACMTFVVGKKISSTGRVIVGHNEDDWPPFTVNHAILPARTWPEGSVLPASAGCAATIPQVSRTLSCFWSEVKFPQGDLNADTFLNEKGVLIVSDSAGSSTERMDDPTLLTEGGVRFNLRRTVGERAVSARDGVRIICELVEKYGYAPSGRVYTVADADEAWLVQVVHGRNYVAVRCPDDEITIMPNLYTVYELDAFAAEDVIVSADLVENAKRKGFWDGKGKFNFAKAYQGSYEYGPERLFEHPNNTGRFRQAIRLLTGREWPQGKPFPFSVKPVKSVYSPEDVKALLSAHNAPLKGGKHVLETWSICSSTTIESSVCEFAGNPRECVLHLALGRGCEKPYLRLRPFVDGLPASIDKSDTAERRLETHVLPVGAEADKSVVFVDCPKCEKRMRISDDGRKAYVNTSKIKPSEKEAMALRAKKLLELARPVEKANKLTPLMGWSSWNTFAVDISEEIIVGIAQTMATNGLKDAGFVYVNIDDGFFSGHDAQGRLQFHPKRFPNGMKGTVDRIHALGMKAGIYSDAGADTCGSIFNSDGAGVGAGLYGHDAADLRLHFNELKFDFIKIDYCGGNRLKLDERTRYTEIGKAIAATGCDVRWNICRWAFPGTWAADIAGSWRTTRDIRASWKSIRDIIAENLYLSAYASVGHFNDLDMLEVGQLKGRMKSAFGSSGDVGITVDEETTHFGMWCMLSSPLVLGNDVRIIPPETLKLVTNPYLLRVNQDPLGLQAYVAARDGEAYVLVKDALTRFGKTRYVALYNASDKECEFKVDSRALDLGGEVSIFDLVEKADFGTFKGELPVKVRPHASRFFLFEAEERLERVRYEAECAYLSDYSEIGDAQKKGCLEGGCAYYAQREGASLGMTVVNLGGRETNDLIWKDVQISASGKRRLTLRYAAKEPCSLFVQVDGGVKKELPIAASNGGFAEVSFELELAKGKHTVRLSNPTAAMPDIDCMEIEPPLSGCAE